MEEQMPQNIPPNPQESLEQAPVAMPSTAPQAPASTPIQSEDILTGSETLDAPTQQMQPETLGVAVSSSATQAQMVDVSPDDDPEVPHEGIFANRLFRKVFYASAALLGIVLLLALGGIGFQRFNKSDAGLGETGLIARIGDQNVTITQQLPAQANTVALRDGVPTVLISGDLAVQGLVQIIGSQGTLTFDAGNVAGGQKITLPNASGEICLSSNNCNFATGGAATTVIVQGVDPNTIDGGVTSLNGSKGALILQGTTDQVTITESGTTLTFGLPQNIGPDSSPQFTSINLSTVGTQNGFNICDSGNNCNYASTADAIIQGGNAFDAVVRIGSRDNFGLDLLTNNTTRLSITNNGGITIGGSSQDRLTITSQIAGSVAMVFQGATEDIFTTSLVVADPTAPRTIILPNADGTICLSGGNCSGSGGYGDVLNGGNNFNALMSLGTNDNFGFNLKTMNTNRITIGNTGNIALLGNTAVNANVSLGQDSSSRLSFLGQLTGAAPFVFQGATDDSFATALLVEDPTANRTILLPNADGTICLSSGNCSGPVGTGDVLQGGNNFGATMVLGTNDNFGFNFKTNNTVRLSITNTGNATFSDDLNVQGNVVLGTSDTNRLTINGEILGAAPFVFQGATDNSYATYFMVADPTATRSIILPNADGTICLSSGNCSTSGGAGDVLQGGNNFNATMILGTNDNFGFNLKTDNTDRITISNTGLTTVLQDFHVNGNTVLGNDPSDNVIIQAGNMYAPNNLNIDTYTQYIDTVNDQVGFGTLPLGVARVGILATNGGDGLTVNLGSSAGNILNLQDNGVNVMTVADGGATTMRNSVDSTGAFQIQNAAGASLVNVDSSNNAISLLGNNSGETGAWLVNSGLPANRFSAATVTANGYVYVIGGGTSSSLSTAVSTSYYAKINANGTVGTYTATTALPANRMASGAVVANGYVYVVGGSDGTSGLTTTLYAKLNADGTLGAWQTSSQTFPSGVARVDASVVTANGYIYAIGGSDIGGTIVGTTLYAKLNADGTLGAWQTSANSLPGGAVRRQMGAAVANGYVYVLGGTPSSSPAVNTYSAKLNADGTIGTWAATGNNLPKTTRAMGTVVANGYIYIVGGEVGGGTQSDEVYYSRFGTNGALGAWTLAANKLAVTRFFNTAVTYNGYIYSIGGGSGTYYASLPRLQVGGSLDLVGLQGQNMADPGDLSQGSTGGSLTAGNGTFVGSLQVQGQAEFASSLSVLGNINTSGQANFKNSTNSANAFQVQDTAGANMLNVDTANNRVTIGVASTTPTLFVVSSKTTAGDPAGVDGSMYYNSNSGRFRCYQTGVWVDCIGSSSGAGDITQGGNNFGGSTAMTIGTLNNGGVNIITNSTSTLSLSSAGAALFKNASNSTTAFQIQNTAGTSLLTADTTNQTLSVGVTSDAIYMSVQNVAGSYASTPNSVAAAVTGDIDLRAKIGPTSWTPAGSSNIIAKQGGAGSRSYSFLLNASGALQLNISLDGTAQVGATSTAAVSGGGTQWVRVTRASASGNVNFYTSVDGVSWTPLGTTVSSTSGSIFNSTAQVQVGGGVSNPLAGNIYRAQIVSGIAGTLKVDFNPNNAASTASTSWTSSVTGEVWTLAGSTSLAGSTKAAATFAGLSTTLSNNVLIRNTGSDSTTALQIQNAAGTSLLTADTANNIITIGGAASASPTLFVLSTKNTTGDPASTINGSMYYNSDSGRFRCYQNNLWTDCIGSGMGTGDISQGGNSFGQAITIGTNDAYTLNFETNGVTRVSIAASGANVRIGSTAAGAGKLILDDGGSLANEAEIYSDSSANINLRAYATSSDINMMYGSNGNYGMYLDGATGGVGIGITSPGAKLHVANNSAASIALLLQGATGQSANIQEWQTSAGSRLGSFGMTSGGRGVLSIDNGPVLSATTSGDGIIRPYNGSGRIIIQNQSGGSDVQALLVRAGNASQSANLQEWQNSNGDVLSAIGSSGQLVVNGSSPYDSQVMATIYTNNGSSRGLIIRGGNAQTADLQQWRAHGGGLLASVGANGEISLGDNSASAGAIRLKNTDSLYARNAANNGDIALIGTNVSDQVLIANGGAETLFGGDVTLATGAVKLGVNVASVGTIRLENNTGIYARNAADTDDVLLMGIDAGDQVVVGYGATNTKVLSDLEVTGSLTTGTPISVTTGGTGATSFTQYGILFGNGTGALQAVAVGNSGQCLTANTGAAPTWGSCTPGGTGDISQGGNSFGMDMTLGAIDNYGFNVLTNNVATFKLSNTGAATFQNASDSATAFQIQNAAGTSLFNVDSTNARIYIGNATPDGIGTLLVLDNKNTSGDPAGVDGGMYYNSNLGKFRCYENGEWKDCLTNVRTATKPSDQTFNSTSYSGVSGLSFNVLANQSYRLQCTLLLSVPVGTSGGNVSTLGPGSPVQYTATFAKAVESSGDNYATSSTYDDTSAATSFRVNTISTGSNRFIISYNAILNNGGSAGTWQLRAKAADGSSSITFYANSSCDLKPL